MRILSLGILLISGLASSAINAQHLATETDDYSTTVVASGFTQPWAHEFLPNGDILVTERIGNIKVIRDGTILKQGVSNVPSSYYAGQGGLLDIMLDSDFSNNHTLYLSYAFGDSDGNATRLISAILDTQDGNYSLENVNTLFTATPLKQTPQHYSGRIAQMDDGSLLLTIGDGFDYREDAQRMDNHLGKIIRINRDGSVPSDNPFVANQDAKPEIWSYGHRNHQGLVIANGVVYQNEHGPKGGDEVNIIEAGLNYGWPVITRGRDYNGASVTPYTEYADMQQPLIDWTPSIAPSSMTFYLNKLYVSSLAEKSIRVLTTDSETINDQGIVFEAIKGRIRDIAVGLDNHLYVLTDGDQGELIKITQVPAR